jgi:hypothetical protein
MTVTVLRDGQKNNISCHKVVHRFGYRGTSHIRNHHTVAPYSRTMPRLLWRSQGGRRAFFYERGTPVGLRATSLRASNGSNASQIFFCFINLDPVPKEGPWFSSWRRPLSLILSHTKVYELSNNFISKKAFIITDIKNKLTDLCGNWLLQNDFINTFGEIKLPWHGPLRRP